MLEACYPLCAPEETYHFQHIEMARSLRAKNAKLYSS